MSLAKSKVPRAKHHLQVFARVRPLNGAEKNRGLSVVHCSANEVSVKDRQDQKVIKTFWFDRVFDQDSTQVEVYNHVVKPAIEDIIKGYNYTVFAYGQSGSGKTYTIAGNRSPDQAISWEDDPMCGLLPRSLAHLLDELRLIKAEFTIRASFLEICNEEMVDLLSQTGDSSKLRLYDDASRKGMVLVHGLQEEVLHNHLDINSVLQKCLAQQTSSRSHTVFTATVHIKENSMQGEELVRSAKLCLVDLAASENSTRSTAVDKGAREMASTNHSLLMLGRVITALVERAPHIPYRESKLTRLLRDTLSGRSRASFIGTVSPAPANMDETLGTLEYVHRARNIIIKPELNPKLTKESLIKEYTEEIERLRRDLDACRNRQGVYLLHDDYTKLASDVNSLNKEISENLASIKDFHHQIFRQRERYNDLGVQLELKNKELTQSRIRLREQLSRREETKHLLERHHNTEESLSDQASVLLRVVDETSAHLRALHDKLDRNRRIICENESKMRELGSEFCRDMQMTAQEVERLIHKSSESITCLKKRIENYADCDKLVVSAIGHHLLTLAATHDKGIKVVERVVNEMARASTALLDKMVAGNTDTAKLDALFQDYSQNILPSLHNICVRSKLCTAKIVDMFKCFEAKNLEVTKWATSSVQKQRESVLDIREQFVKEVTKRKAQKVEMRNLIHGLKERQASTNAELLVKMEDMRTALRVAKVNGAEYQHILAGASEECKEQSKAAAAVNQRVTTDLNLQQETDAQLVSEMKTRRAQLVADLNVALDQAKAMTAEVQTDITNTRSNVKQFVVAGAAAWTARSEQVRADMATLSKQLCAGMCEQESMVRQVCTATGNEACACAVQTEQLQLQASTSVGGVLTQLKSDCENVVSCCERMTSILQQAGGVASRIAEDYVEDQPTGNTPERKEYEYPRVLAATSPHEKILAEFRASRKTLHTDLQILNTTTEEEEVLPCQDESEASSMPATEGTDTRELSPCSEVSSVRAVSGSEPDLYFMDQDKENVSAVVAMSTSKLPVKITGSSKKGTVSKQILSPLN